MSVKRRAMNSRLPKLHRRSDTKKNNKKKSIAVACSSNPPLEAVESPPPPRILRAQPKQTCFSRKLGHAGGIRWCFRAFNHDDYRKPLQASPRRSSSSRSPINQTMPKSNLQRISPERRAGRSVITAAFSSLKVHKSLGFSWVVTWRSRDSYASAAVINELGTSVRMAEQLRTCSRVKV